LPIYFISKSTLYDNEYMLKWQAKKVSYCGDD